MKSEVCEFWLVGAALAEPLTTTGMVVSLPTYPLVRGETFEVEVHCNTGGQVLTLWVLRFTYDAAVLEYVPGSTATHMFRDRAEPRWFVAVT